MLLNRFKDFSINLNARHVNGMTPFDLTVRNTVIRYSRVSLKLIQTVSLSRRK